MAWYNSSAYQIVRPLRLGATEGYAVLVEDSNEAHVRPSGAGSNASATDLMRSVGPHDLPLGLRSVPGHRTP
jgi:hypothetical protein